MIGFENLKNAIVVQAAEDYAAAFMGNNVDGKTPYSMMRECERFFHSEWFGFLTSGVINGDWLMRNLKIRELEKVADAYTEMLNDKNSVLLKATVNFSKKKGESKPKPMHYIFAPRLAVGIKDFLRTQLAEVQAEIQKLKAENEQGEKDSLNPENEENGQIGENESPENEHPENESVENESVESGDSENKNPENENPENVNMESENTETEQISEKDGDDE